MTTSRATTALLIFLTAAAGIVFIEVSRAASAGTGEISVNLAVQAGPTAAARTWRFEVVDRSGSVVETLSAATSGDRFRQTVRSAPIPLGRYTVRQVLTPDTRASCEGGAFYEVVSPPGASTLVDLAGPALAVEFTVRPCAAPPYELAGTAPNGPASSAGPGVIGDADVLPAPAVDEVRGARAEGLGGPLPPHTGTTLPVGRDVDSLPLLLALGTALALVPLAGLATVAIQRRFRR